MVSLITPVCAGAGSHSSGGRHTGAAEKYASKRGSDGTLSRGERCAYTGALPSRVPRAGPGGPASGPVVDPAFALWAATCDRRPARPHSVKAPLAELDQQQVDDDHHRESSKEAGGQRDEAEHVCER